MGRWFVGVPGEWGEQPNTQPWPFGAWPLPFGVLFIFGGGAALSIYDRFKRAKNRKEQRNSVLVALVALMVLNLSWPWALLGPGDVPQPAGPGAPVKITLEGRFNIIAALWSDVATEYFGTAYQVNNPRQFSQEYADKWQHPTSTSLAHVATHPPGAVLFFYSVRRAVENIPALSSAMNGLAASMTRLAPAELYNAAQQMRIASSASAGVPTPTPLPSSAVGAALLCAILLNLALASCIPAVYGLAAMGAPNEEQGDTRGLIAASLFVLAPTLNLFTFTLDALIAAGVLWCLWCGAKAWNGGSPRWLIASGAIFGLTVFLSIGAAASTLLIAIAFGLHRRDTLLRDAGLWLGGALAVAAVLLILFPFNPLEVFGNAMTAHRNATVKWRSWGKWAVMNPVMWVLFCGWPLVVGLVLGLAKRSEDIVRTPGWSYGVAALVTMVFLSVSGNVRGEVERLWLFLLAPLAILAASHLPWRMAAPLIILQAIQTTLMAATLAPLVRPF